MQLSVVIVNYNVKYFLEQCLCSLLTACSNIEAEIFVVDNNSTDGSREFLEPLFPAVNFIWNNGNDGFAKANNIAVAKACGKYIVFLNPDTIVPEDCFEKCISFLESQPAAGALGVKMIDGEGNFLKESKRAFPSPLTSFYKLSGLTSLFPHSKIFARYYLGHLPDNENHAVDVLAGAFMIIPAGVLKKTGSFDERFFMYGEDVDLSYRIQQTGFINYYFAGTTIIHFKGESTKKGSPGDIRNFYKAMSLFVNKHYSSGRARIYNFFIQPAIWLSAGIATIGGFFRRMVKRPIGPGPENIGNTAYQTIIVSNEKDFYFLKDLVQQQKMPEKILGRVDINTTGMADTLCDIQQLPELISRLGVKEIIYCVNGAGLREIISIIQQLPEGIHNKFHASGSNSIVGSKSKVLQGVSAAVK
jgi:GT2 family glycosyltransferase